MKYLSILFLSFYLFGCGPSIDDRREETAEAQYFNYTSEVCSPEKLEYLCQTCNEEYPEMEGKCATSFEDGTICYAGYNRYEDYLACTKKFPNENCSLCY